MSDDTKSFDLILGAIRERSITDTEFRQELIANPEGTLESIGISLSDCSSVNIIDGQSNELNIVLPPAANSDEAGELSEEDLENVAGGRSSFRSKSFAKRVAKMSVNLGSFRGRFKGGDLRGITEVNETA